MDRQTFLDFFFYFDLDRQAHREPTDAVKEGSWIQVLVLGYSFRYLHITSIVVL